MTNHYHLPIGESITTAWHKVHGSKKTFWAAIGIMILTVIVFSIVENGLRHFSHGLAGLVNLIGQIIVFLMQMGILYIGILRARDFAINYREMYRAFSWERGLKIVGAYILMLIVFAVPMLIATVIMVAIQTMVGEAGKLIAAILYLAAFAWLIFFSVRFYLTLGTILDKNLNPIAAIKASYHATQCNFWGLFAIILIKMLVIVVSIIPLGIGLIWSLPFAFNLYGTIYNRLMQGQTQTM